MTTRAQSSFGGQLQSFEKTRQQISDLLESLGEDTSNRDIIIRLINEVITIARSKKDRLDLKIMNSALAELNHAFDLFAPYRKIRKLTIFGSARTTPDEVSYQMAKELAGLTAADNWMIVTGGGPGIMAAGISGAGAHKAFGINISLPFEKPFLEPGGGVKLLEMKYFFTRKLMLMKESDAFASLPGGFGTLDETFELLTLMQTGKAQLAPLVLVEPEGMGYWEALEQFLQSQASARGLISEEDLKLYRICHSVEEAKEEIVQFYANYHSLRWVGDDLILRLLRPPNEAMIDSINERFSSLCSTGKIEATSTHHVEISDGDNIDLYRLHFKFNRRSYAGLRSLIDFVNLDGLKEEAKKTEKC